MIYCIYNYYYI